MSKKVLFLCVAAIFCASLASAQTTGVLAGTVRDAQGLVLPGVTITVTGESLIGQRVLVSQVDGTYRVPALPPGEYAATYELPGFATLRREGIVMVVQTTITINASLQVATVAETITVTGESPVVDVKTSRVGVTFGETELYDVPSASDVWSVLSQTPGVRMAGYDVGGSHKSQQSGFETFGLRGQGRVTSDGVNSTENAGGAGFYYDYYSVDEFQVGAVGSDVEQDTPGGSIVMVIKSGGNQLTSLFNIDYEPSSFIGENIDSDLEARAGTTAPVKLFWEAHIDVGGPIVKDKAWFYGGYNYFKIDKVISGVPEDLATDIGLFDAMFAKLTFQVSPKDTIIGYSQLQLKQKPTRGLSLTTPPGSTGPQSSWGWVHKVEWQRVWNDRVFTKLFGGLFGYDFPRVPEPGVTFDANPPRTDLDTGINSGAFWESFVVHYIKPQMNGQINYYLPDAAGQHDFKFGFDFQNDGRNFGRNGASGPYRYRDDSGLGIPANPAVGQQGNVSEILFSSAPVLAEDRNRRLDFFAQDIWSVNNRVTVNFGFRTMRQNFYYNDAERSPLLCETNPDTCFIFETSDVTGQDYLSWNNFALRGGATFDVTGKGRTVLKVFAGRYYESGGYGSKFQANPSSTNYNRFQFLDPNGNGVYDGTDELGTLLEATGGSNTRIDADVKNAYADEFSVSLEHEIAADTGFRFTYVRKQHRLEADAFDFNRAFNLTVPVTQICTGCPLGFDGAIVNLLDIPDDRAGQADTVVANVPDGADQNWDIIQLGVTRRFRGGFFFQTGFDYQWRQEMKDASDVSTSPLNSDPIAVAYQINHQPSVGLSQNTNAWTFKVLTRYILPKEVGIAMNFQHQSGFPWAPIYSARLPNSGTRRVFLEDVSNNRSDNVTLIGLRLDKSINFGSPWGGDQHSMSVMLDIYNILNTNAETNFIMRTGSSFNNIIEYIPARTFKIGLRYQF